MVIIIIGHVTKEGTIAGPKMLEHMVDTVLYLEGDDRYEHRILRSAKNRFGATNEVGIFQMNEKGCLRLPILQRCSYRRGVKTFQGHAYIPH